MISAWWTKHVWVLPLAVLVPRTHHGCTLAISPWERLELFGPRVDFVVERVFVVGCIWTIAALWPGNRLLLM